MFNKLVSLFSRDIGDITLINAVAEYMKEQFADSYLVLHEPKSSGIHFDGHVVLASETRPFITIVTSGMAQRKMHVPKGSGLPPYMELVLFLPPKWPIDKVAEDDKALWPFQVLRMLADYPHNNRTFFIPTHTLPLGMEDPFEGRFSSILIYEPKFLPDPEPIVVLDDGRVVLLHAVMFLREEELAFDMEHGIEEFSRRIEEQGLLQDMLVFNPNRKSVDLS